MGNPLEQAAGHGSPLTGPVTLLRARAGAGTRPTGSRATPRG